MKHARNTVFVREGARRYRPATMQEAAAYIGASLREAPERICMNSPATVREFLRGTMHGLEHEEFHVVFLDAHNRVIAHEAMFRGTLTQTAVYPREIIKACLRHNAGGVLLVHCHPSGVADASPADRRLTDTLKVALSHVDIQLLDHLIVAGPRIVSFAESGWI